MWNREISILHSPKSTPLNNSIVWNTFRATVSVLVTESVCWVHYLLSRKLPRQDASWLFLPGYHWLGPGVEFIVLMTLRRHLLHWNVYQAAAINVRSTPFSLSILRRANLLTLPASFLKIGLWPPLSIRQTPRISRAPWAISWRRVFTRTDLGCPVNAPHNIIFFVSNSVCP